MKKARKFILFAGPALFFFLFIIGASFVSGVQLSFTDWNGLADSYRFIGLENFIGAFRDMEFIISLGKTFTYVFFVVILTNIIAFGIAFGLTRGLRMQGVYRVGFFTPNLIGGVVLGLIWRFVFSTALPGIGEFFEYGIRVADPGFRLADGRLSDADLHGRNCGTSQRCSRSRQARWRHWF